jgi:hypothetical protein
LKLAQIAALAIASVRGTNRLNVLILFNGSPNQKGFDRFLTHPNLAGLITPRSWQLPGEWHRHGKPWALDNDCFQGLDREAFIKMLKRFQNQPGCLWVAAPDVVGDAQTTLARFKLWQPVLHYFGYPVALVAQNGLEDLTIPWGKLDCIFIGGDTAWKIGPAAAAIIKQAKNMGKLVHMGRVNTRKRLNYAIAIGCDSIDGTGIGRFRDRELPWALGMSTTVQMRMEVA